MNVLKSNDSKKTTRTVAILGLTANPVTNGHIDLGKLIADYVDEVWFLPCYKHNSEKKPISAFHRLQMCIIATSPYEKFRVCDYEILNESSGRAWETICGLKRKYPEVNFSWVIGADNADEIHKWYRWEGLIHTTKFWVVDRKGYKLKGGWYENSPHQVIRHKWKEEISSTMVRDLLFNFNPDVTKYVPPDVLEYIIENDLYRG